MYAQTIVPARLVNTTAVVQEPAEHVRMIANAMFSGNAT